MDSLYRLAFDQQPAPQQPSKTILFDCDDTLVNSEIIAMGVAIDIIADEIQKQKPTTEIDRPSFVRYYAGWHFHTMMQDMGNQFGLDLKVTEDLDRIKTTRTLDALQHVTETVGTGAALQRLHKSGTQMAVVTSSEFNRVNLCLEQTGLDAFFSADRKFSAHDSLPQPKHKPDPAIYQYALNQLGIENPQDTVAIEDSLSGVKSAVQANIPVIGFVGSDLLSSSLKSTQADKLLRNGATIVISHMDDLEAAIAYVADRTPGTFKHKTFTEQDLPPPATKMSI